MPIFFEDSDKLCAWVAGQTQGTCLLSFSGGKDSLASWIQLRRHFDRIVPIFMYRMPHLSFQDEMIAHYERDFGCHIYQMPHPALYRWWNELTLQAPENCRILEAAELPDFDYDDIFNIVKGTLGLPESTYTAVGVRAVDNPIRWSSIKTHGAVNETRYQFYPIYDWRKDRLLAEIQTSGIQLPREYHLFGRSFDGLDYRFLKPIRDHYPDDYRRILEMFPLAELELKRIEYREEYYAQHR